MSITSYAQNFEDVMLWRVLGHIPNGFYIDVGAQHPVIDSVSKAFYEHGWRGVHVEATAFYATLVRADRPDEIVLQVALSDKPGSLTFYEIPDTGLSTGDAAIAEHHRSRGFNVVETVVNCITLADVFAQIGQRDIHWLKIDVEGMETQVLAGWGNCPAQPWVLVVESTYPNSQIETHQAWEAMVLARGYIHVYFDGLSRYYVLANKPDLAQKFNTPPNIFDGFSLALSVPYNAPTRNLMQQKEQTHQDQLISEQTRATNELQTVRETSVQNEKALGKYISQLQHQISTTVEQKTASMVARDPEATQQIDVLCRQHTERERIITQQLQTSQEKCLSLQKEQTTREQTLLEQTSQAKQEVEHLLRTQLQREQAVAEKLEVLRSQAMRESAELVHNIAEKQLLLQNQHAARENATVLQLKAEKQERSKHEQTLLERTRQAKQEVENLLRLQAQREREVLAQLLAVQQQATRERNELARSQADKLREVGSQAAQSEKVLKQQLHTHQQELRNLHKNLVKREQEAGQEKVELARCYSDKEHALLRQQINCEKTHSLQLLAQQDEFHHLQQEHLKLEQTLLEEHKKIGQQRNGLRDALVLREQETLAQLQAARKQAAQEIAELLRKQSEQKHDLHRQHSEREENLTQQLQGVHQTLQLRAEQYSLELSNKLEERTRLLEACAALEAQLQAEMQTGQQTSMHLRQLLKQVQHSLEMTHTSLSWRITAPLRKLVWIFALNKNQTLAPIGFSASAKPDLVIQVAAEPPPITINQALLEQPMPPSTPAISPNMPTIASTLAELLACHDQQFVVNAYQTLLGRAPDSEGLGYYLGRLRTGFSKIQILAQLRLSNEGKKYTANVQGLDTAIRQHQQGQYPLIGWLFRQFNGSKEHRSTDQTLRSIENKIFMLSNDSHLRFNQLEIALDSLHNLIVQQTQSIAVSLGISAKDNFNATPSTSNLPLEPDGLRNLSPHARDVYFQLKTVAELYSQRVN